MVGRMVRKGALHSAGSRRRFQPALEALEPRLALANCVWTGAFGNNAWFNAFNWSTLSVPGTSDTAAFTQPAPNCTISGANAVVGCLIMQGWGGTLTIANGATLTVSQTPTSGPSEITDGIITGNGSASLIFSNSTTVSLGGVINPPSTKFWGKTSLSGGVTVSLGGAVANGGNFTVQSGTVLMQPSCVFTNNSNFYMEGQGSAAAPTNGLVNGQLFMNAGSVFMASAGNTSCSVPFVNCSFLDVQNGTLTFSGEIIQQAGTLDIATGAILASTTGVEIDGGSLYSGTSVISGDLRVTSASVYPGVLDATPYGTLSISGMYKQDPASSLGISILLNSNGSVKQYTKLTANDVLCAGSLTVGTGPFRVTPQKTDVANIISSQVIGGDFNISGGVPGTNPALVWVHNLTNPPPNTYQLKITKGLTQGVITKSTTGVQTNALKAPVAASLAVSAPSTSTPERRDSLLQHLAMDLFLMDSRLHTLDDPELLMVWMQGKHWKLLLEDEALIEAI